MLGDLLPVIDDDHCTTLLKEPRMFVFFLLPSVRVFAIVNRQPVALTAYDKRLSQVPLIHLTR